MMANGTRAVGRAGDGRVSVALASLAGFLFAVNIIGTRVTLDRQSVRADAVAFVTVLISAVVALPIALALGTRFEDFTWDNIQGFVLVGAVVPGIGQLTFYVAIAMAGPSRVGVMVGTVPMWSVVMAIIFLDESWSWPIIVGTVLTVVGGALLAHQGATNRQVSSLGLALAAITAFLFGLRDVLSRNFTQESALDGAAAAVVILATGAAILMVATIVAAGWRGFVDNSRRSFPPVLVAGVSVGFALPALLEAFQRSRVGIVSPLNNATQSVAVVFMAGIFFGGTEVNRRIVTAVLIVLAGGTVIGITR